jgi:hypothetical protein
MPHMEVSESLADSRLLFRIITCEALVDYFEKEGREKNSSLHWKGRGTIDWHGMFGKSWSTKGMNFRFDEIACEPVRTWYAQELTLAS